jgi:hypothetical protein
MKVWVLTSGEYSDYRIHGVFSSEQTLKATKEKIDGPGGWSEWNEPEEYELDNLLNLVSKGFKKWYIRFDASANVERIAPSEILVDSSPGAEASFSKPGVVQIELLATSEEDALKIASEKRREFLAQKAGVAS